MRPAVRAKRPPRTGIRDCGSPPTTQSVYIRRPYRRLDDQSPEFKAEGVLRGEHLSESRRAVELAARGVEYTKRED